jgi:hypothetical protein
VNAVEVGRPVEDCQEQLQDPDFFVNLMGEGEWDRVLVVVGVVVDEVGHFLE